MDNNTTQGENQNYGDFGRCGQGRGQFRGRGHGRERWTTDKSQIQYYTCNKFGYYSYEYYQNPTAQEQANYVEQKKHKVIENLLLACNTV